MADIQAALERQFAPPLDTSLIAAIAYEPGQTLQSAKELCETLAAAAIVENGTDDEHSRMQAQQPPVGSSQAGEDPEMTSDRRSKSPSTTGKQRPKVNTGSARRRNFGGQLTSSSPLDSPGGSSPRAASTDASTLEARDFGASTGSTTPTSIETGSSSTDMESVQRLLEEWQLIDKTNHDPDNLRLTDEENDTDHEAGSPSNSSLPASIQKREAREAERVAEAAGDGQVDPQQLAKGEESLSSLPNGQLPESISEEERFDPLVFLQHAFPSRTPAFLKETLDDARGSIQEVIDTLMTIDLIESEDARQAELGILRAAGDDHSSASARERAKGLDYDALAKGLAARDGVDVGLKGKKRKAARRRLQDEQRRAGGQAGGVSIGVEGNGRKANAKPGKVKVNLTDVRHGAPINTVPTKLLRTASEHQSTAAPDTPFDPRLTDEELAAKLAAEEEAMAADPDDNQPVRDNAWLLTSSVLSQLSTLLDLEPTKITSIYNGASFNLAIALARAVEFAADRYQTLESLDVAGDAPAGTAKRMCDGISDIAGVGKSQASRAFRATRGRQDATLDLLQLEQVVRTATGDQALDALDPLGKLSHPDTNFATAEAPAIKGVSIEAGNSAGKFQEAFPTPLQAARAGKSSDDPTATKYSRVVGRREAGPPTGAAAALRSGAAIATVLPASAATVVRDPDVGLSGISNERLGLAPHISAHDPLRRMTEYRLVAEEYRQRRDEALRKAGNAWRSSKGGVRIGGKGGDGGKGGTAWYYADEARRLDAKSRAWSLKAAEALVEDRRRAGVGVVRGDVSSHLASSSQSVGSGAQQGNAFNTIDLHGVTVHEALSIVREQVTRWYARPSTSGLLSPFRIITGVGRHSPHQIAVLRPAVAKMLEREGWRYDVDHQRGVIIVRGVK